MATDERLRTLFASPNGADAIAVLNDDQTQESIWTRINSIGASIWGREAVEPRVRDMLQKYETDGRVETIEVLDRMNPDLRNAIFDQIAQSVAASGATGYVNADQRTAISLGRLEQTIENPNIRAIIDFASTDPVVAARLTAEIRSGNINFMDENLNPQTLMATMRARVLSDPNVTPPNYDGVERFLASEFRVARPGTDPVAYDTFRVSNVSAAFNGLDDQTQGILFDEILAAATRGGADTGRSLPETLRDLNGSITPDMARVLGSLAQNENTRGLVHDIIRDPAFLGRPAMTEGPPSGHAAAVARDPMAAVRNVLERTDISADVRTSLTEILSSAENVGVIGQVLQQGGYQNLSALFNTLPLSGQQDLGRVLGSSFGLGEAGADTSALRSLDTFVGANPWMANLVATQPQLIERILENRHLVDGANGVTPETMRTALVDVLSGGDLTARSELSQGDAAPPLTVDMDVFRQVIGGMDERALATFNRLPENIQEVLAQRILDRMNSAELNADGSAFDINAALRQISELGQSSVYRGFTQFLGQGENATSFEQFLRGDPSRIDSILNGNGVGTVTSWMGANNGGLSSWLSLGSSVFSASGLGEAFQGFGQVLQGLFQMITGGENGLQTMMDGFRTMFGQFFGTERLANFEGRGVVNIGTIGGIENLGRVGELFLDAAERLGMDRAELERMSQSGVTFSYNARTGELLADRDAAGDRYQPEVVDRAFLERMRADLSPQPITT